MFLTLISRILTFLSEYPSSTARVISEGLGAPRTSVAAYLTRMSYSRAVIRSRNSPFTYTLLDPLTAETMPTRVLVPLRKETKLADEQLVLTALTEGRASDRKTLALSRWPPNRLKQTLDRLHSAGLVKMVHGSYVLISQSP